MLLLYHYMLWVQPRLALVEGGRVQVEMENEEGGGSSRSCKQNAFPLSFPSPFLKILEI
jgi:hypothetical protein